jgi:hypothetical protein
MKKLFLLPILALFAVIVSCSSDDDNNMPEIVAKEFTGKLLLNGSPITDGIRCGLYVIDGEASITLYGVSFAPAMPAMDITMPMLNCKKSADGYEISGTNVLPKSAGEPMMDFLMPSVTAFLKGDVFVVSAQTAMGTIGFSNALLTPVQPSVGEMNYKGELLFGDLPMEVVVNVTMDKAGAFLDLVINDVKFAEKMPPIDITLKGIPYSKDADVLVFNIKDIDPYMNAEPEALSSYRFAFVNGEISSNGLSFVAKMADSAVHYVAGKEFAFTGSEVVE